MGVRRPPFGGEPGEPQGTPGGVILPDHEHGRGTYDPETGLWEWYELPEDRQDGGGTPVSWEQILTNWPTVADDLLSEYGIDVYAPEVRRRPWWWLRDRIRGLLAADTRIARLLAPPRLPDISRR